MGSNPYRDREGAAETCDGYPLAYFITFRCYGTWLHGDARGSVDREHNVPGTALLAANARLSAYRVAMLKGEPQVFDTTHRAIVEQTVREVSAHHGWALHAVNVRTNHAHAVVSAACAPEGILNAWKSWSTRRLRQLARVSSSQPVWSRHGSTRYLWTKECLAHAVRYVEEGQGNDDAPEAGAL
jgi:REP element-mobilizing transposase RayT